MRVVHLALGSNVGDRLENLRAALAYLLRYGRLTAVSALYETAPFGVLDQPPFFNAACGLDTDLSLDTLLDTVKRIEWELGRRPSQAWGPRPIDIDILLAGAELADTPRLTVPHARLAERAFVLTPLAEIAANAVHPGLKRTMHELLVALPDSEKTSVRWLSGPEWAIAPVVREP